ncbi:MAG TPA: hypothetical protein VNC22_23280 [Sporichthya sp.]|jgi:hypothetical protein|nr:hypothetical protein [Sporichthya sp.]
MSDDYEVINDEEGEELLKAAEARGDLFAMQVPDTDLFVLYSIHDDGIVVHNIVSAEEKEDG